MCDAGLREGVAACPFLRRVAVEQGEQFALRLAINPFKPVVDVGPSSPLFPEDALSFHTAFSLFHGPQGALPLPPKASRCPLASAERVEEHQRPALAVHFDEQAEVSSSSSGLTALPLASMSSARFGNLPDPGKFLRRLRARKQKREGGADGKSGDKQKARASRGKGPGSGSGGIKGRPRVQPLSQSSHGAAPGGACPLRALGPLAALLPTTRAGHLRCPAPITRLRGAIASLAAVRGLRPQGLPVRGAALAGVAFIGNLPAGMVREHTEKFSPAWFLAVHFAVPFVAMLRKAVLLPNWALLLTLAGSVAGQAAGARLERARCAGTLRMPQLRLLPPAPADGQEDTVWPAFASVASRPAGSLPPAVPAA